MNNNSEKEESMPERIGQLEEVSGQVFDGKLKAYQTLVFVE